MTVTELFLRLGAHLVAWLVLYTYCIWLAVIPQVGCGSEGQELFRLVFGFAPFAMLAALLLRVAYPLHSVVGYLKWLAVPMVILVPLALRPIVDVFSSVTLDALAYCGQSAAPVWHLAWAPCNFAGLALISFLSVRFFFRARQIVQKAGA